jgi:hypothetical protein
MTRCSNPRGGKTRRKTSRVNGLPSIGPPPAQRRAAEMADSQDLKDLDRRCGDGGLQRAGSGRVHVSLGQVGSAAPKAPPTPSRARRSGPLARPLPSCPALHPPRERGRREPRRLPSGRAEQGPRRVVHHCQHVIERGEPSRCQRCHHAIPPWLHRALRPPRAGPFTASHRV